MPRVNIALAKTLGRGVSKAAGMQSLTNMYLQPVMYDGRTQFAAYRTPGRTLFSTIGGGLPRGAINAADKHYAVIGNALYLVGFLGVTTNLGFIEGTELVDMSFNGVQLDIVAETKTYSFDTLTLALTEITAANFEAASSVASVASYSVYAVKDTGRFRWRLVNTPTFSALDFATAEAEADELKAIRKVGNQLAMLGSTSLEWWQPTGDAGAFAFGKTQVAAASIGCLSRDSAIVVDNTLFWVGRDGKAGGASVYRADGFSPKRVSTPEVDYYLEQIVDISQIHAFTHQELGHQFLILTVTNELTLALDISTNIWTFRKSGQWSMGAEPTGGWDAVTFALNGVNQIIGSADGNLYKLEHGTYTELGNGIIAEITLPQIHNGGRRGFMSRLEVDIEAGVGTGAGLQGGNDELTKILLTFDGADGATAILDTAANGGSNHAWTAVDNAQVDTAQSKFGGSSGLFDGTGDYWSTPDHADFALGSGDFTIDTWFNCDAAGGTFRTIAGQLDAGVTPTNISFFLRRLTSNFIAVNVNVGSTVYFIVGTTQFTNAVNTGWHHVAVVRTGDVLKLFLDGIQEGGNAAIIGTVNDSPNAFAVGRLGEAAGQDWLGWIDEFRLSVGIARWTANFSPPSAAYTQSLLGIGADPQVMESHSDDGGNNWSTPRNASLGQIGETKHRAYWLAMGSFRQRIIKLRVSDPVKWAVTGVIADIDVAGH